MLDKYGLRSNSWLQRQFELKRKCALVSGKKIFFVDMSTTQRIESTNNQMKKYIVYNYDLVHFFHYHQRLVDNKCHKELKVDFQATQSRLSLEYLMKILQHTANVCTLAVFKLFRHELWLT